MMVVPHQVCRQISVIINLIPCYSGLIRSMLSRRESIAWPFSVTGRWTNPP